MEMMVIDGGGSDVLYKNFKGKWKTNQIETFSKLFLINDSDHDLKKGVNLL